MARMGLVYLFLFLFAVRSCAAQAGESSASVAPPPAGNDGVCTPALLASLLARQQVMERVLRSSLEVDNANAVIDLEIEEIRSIRSDLQAARDRAQNYINIATIMTGGALGVVGSALQFRSSTANIGNGIAVGGGSASVLLSIIGIHKQTGGRRTLGDSPRMLAPIFGRTADASGAIASNYPDAVWTYLNSPTPSHPTSATRREQLIAKWQNEGRIEKEASPKSEVKLESVTGNVSLMRRFTIDQMNDRVAMLLDVRGTLSMMKRDLLVALTTP